MNTHREAILQTIVSTLVAAGTPAAANVFRSRVEAMTRDEMPAIVVKPGAESVDHSGRQVAQRRFDIHIHVHARGTPADQLADPTIAAAHTALMADQTLGGRVYRLVEKETLEPEFADGDDTAVQITLIYTALYMTTASDITRLAT